MGLKYNYLNPPEIPVIAEQIVDHASIFDEDILIKCVYADWNDKRNVDIASKWKGYQPRQVTRKNMGKDRADLAISLDALELCYGNKDVSCFCIASGDADYVDIATRLKAFSKKVTFIGVKKTFSPDLINYSTHPSKTVEDYCEQSGYQLVELHEIISLLFNIYQFHKEKGGFLGLNNFRKTLLKKGIVATEKDSHKIIDLLFEEGLVVKDFVDNPKSPFKTSVIGEWFWCFTAKTPAGMFR